MKGLNNQHFEVLRNYCMLTVESITLRKIGAMILVKFGWFIIYILFVERKFLQFDFIKVNPITKVREKIKYNKKTYTYKSFWPKESFCYEIMKDFNRNCRGDGIGWDKLRNYLFSYLKAGRMDSWMKNAQYFMIILVKLWVQ